MLHLAGVTGFLPRTDTFALTNGLAVAIAGLVLGVELVHEDLALAANAVHPACILVGPFGLVADVRATDLGVAFANSIAGSELLPAGHVA